jgi:hypothetical protein
MMVSRAPSAFARGTATTLGMNMERNSSFAGNLLSHMEMSQTLRSIESLSFSAQGMEEDSWALDFGSVH